MKVPVDVGRHILSFCDQPTLDRTLLVSRGVHKRTRQVRCEEVENRARARKDTTVPYPLPRELVAQNCVQPRGAAIVADMNAWHGGPNGQVHPDSPIMESFYTKSAAFHQKRRELTAALQAPIPEDFIAGAQYFVNRPAGGMFFTGYFNGATRAARGILTNADRTHVWNGSFVAGRAQGACTHHAHPLTQQAFFESGRKVRFVAELDVTTGAVDHESLNAQNEAEFVARVDPATGHHYHGEVKQRQPHGYGVRRVGGVMMEGIFERGQLRRGFVTFGNGDTLATAFCRVTNRPSGPSTYTWAQTGTRFEGTFSPQGGASQGQLTFADGSAVRGQFRFQSTPTGEAVAPDAAMVVAVETQFATLPPGSMAARFLRPQP